MNLHKGEKTIEELLTIADDEIDYADIPPLSEGFWANAEVVTPDMRAQKQLTLRLDMEVYEWFKTKEKDYPTLINTVLKSYIEAQQKHQG